MQQRKKILSLVILLILAAVGYGWYLYTQKPADVRKQTAGIEMKATELLASFKQDEAAANRQFVDKVMIVSGTVTSIQYNTAGQVTMFLDAGDPLSAVICSFYAEETASAKKVTPGTTVRVKGKCTGLLMDVILNKCSMIE